MKKFTLFLSLYFCFCLLSACGAGVSQPASGEEPPEDSPSLAEDEEPTVILCRIIDGAETGDLLLAELDGGTGVYRLSVENSGPMFEIKVLTGETADGPRPGPVPVCLDGEPADASVLEDGMPVRVSFNGAVQETFPARLGEVCQIAGYSIGTRENPGGSCYDLCGLYLRVLDDLWQKDPALNENIALAGLDLSRAPGDLTESEKSALAWRFGELHGVEVVTGTFEELEEQGYFTATAISTPAPEAGENFSRVWNQWEDGCLFSITPNTNHEGEMYSLPVLFFDAEKWRAPLAAYCFYDCSAGWPEMGTWDSYTIGSEMIS